jgi:hypothetical protein
MCPEEIIFSIPFNLDRFNFTPGRNSVGVDGALPLPRVAKAQPWALRWNANSVMGLLLLFGAFDQLRGAFGDAGERFRKGIGWQ